MDSSTIVTVTVTFALLVLVLTLLGRGGPDPRIAEPDRKLRLIMDHLGVVDPGPEASASFSGHDVAAIASEGT